MSLKKAMKDPAIKAEVDAMIAKAQAAAEKAATKSAKDAVKSVLAEVKDDSDKDYKKAGTAVLKKALEAIG